MNLRPLCLELTHVVFAAIVFLLAACSGSETVTTTNIEPSPQSRFTSRIEGTVTDNLTSLVWERAGNTNLQTFSQADQYCSELNLAGYTDWRIPELRELQSILDYSKRTTAIASDLFSVATIPTTIGYWSSTLSLYDLNYKWCVDFEFGKVYPYHTGSPGISIRCVRGTMSIPPPNLTDNRNGTVSDPTNHLMWEQHANNNVAFAAREWNAAAQYCQDLVLQGYTDWRLPDVTELATIVDYSREWPAINTNIFYNGGSPWSDYYWTSTTTAADDPYVWLINFVDGAIGYDTIYYPRLTRCVRTIE